MTQVATAPVPLARESAEPRQRVGAGRAEWRALTALSPLREEWRALAESALEPNVFYDPAFALAAAPVFGQPGVVVITSFGGRPLLTRIVSSDLVPVMDGFQA